MDEALRRTAVESLSRLAGSDDFRDRSDAGRALAGFAEMPEAAGPLLALVPDAGDTYVTWATAEALLRRKDRAGLAVVASALAVADAQHAEWIHSAVEAVFGVYASERDDALRLAEELARDADDRVALGARRLRDGLAELAPLLRPA